MYLANTEYLSYIDASIVRTPCSKVIIDGIEYSGRTHLKTYPKISHVNSGMIGGFSAATCEFEIYNIDGSVNLNGKEIEVFKGLEINGAASWIPMGLFSATDDNITNNKTARSISFKGLDRAARFDAAFEQGEDITFPCTLLNFVQKICTRRGVTLENTDFPMAELIIEEELNIPSNYTERQLISCAAELGGCIARINRSGNLEISKPYSTGRRISRTRYSAVSEEPVFGPINSVVLGHEGYSDDMVYPAVAPDNLCEWRIEDNPFVENRREELITDIAANIIGMSFIPFKLTDCVEDYIFDINDSVEIESKDGTVFTATVLSKTTSSRIRSELKAETQKSTSTNRKIAGSVKDAIKRVQLDVDHQNNRIGALVEDSVSRMEFEALSDSITVRFDNIENPDTVENVKNAVTSITKDGVNIKNGALTLTDDNGKVLIGINTDENGDMYVSGNIKANSLEADSVDAEAIQTGAITADKLSVGKGEMPELFYNGDFSKSSNSVLGWDGYNTGLRKHTNGAEAYPMNDAANLLDNNTSEFFSTSNWSYLNGTLEKPYENVDFIRIKPATTTGYMILSTPVKLEKGKRYSIAAQINPVDWTSTHDDYKNKAIGYYCDGVIYYFDKMSDFSTPIKNESNVDFVFNYQGETGVKNVGLYFRGLLADSDTSTRINLAWVAVSNTNRAPGFYSSRKEWIIGDYFKESNLINNGTTITSAKKYIEHYSSKIDAPDLQIFFQKKYLESGKRYSLITKLQFIGYSSASSSPKLGIWGQNSDGEAYYFDQFNPSGIDAYSNIVKFVFDYEGETGMVDLGVAWKEIKDSSAELCDAFFYWAKLYQDSTDNVGFYSEDANWLKSAYRSSNLLTSIDYGSKPALEVFNEELYFYGDVISPHGNIGCLNYSQDRLSVNSATYYYQNASNPDESGQSAFSSSIEIINPNPILSFEEIGSLYAYDLIEAASSRMVFRVTSSSGGTYTTKITPYGLKAENHKGESLLLMPDGVGFSNISKLSLAQIRYLIRNTPEA